MTVQQSGWHAGPSVYVGSIAFGAMGQSLIVLDKNRRLYAGLSRDASYVHVVHPCSIDLSDANGAVLVREGELTCTCKGARFRGDCYRVHQAKAYEAQIAGGSAEMVAEHDEAERLEAEESRNG